MYVKVKIAPYGADMVTDVGIQTIEILNGLLDWAMPEESTHFI